MPAATGKPWRWTAREWEQIEQAARSGRDAQRALDAGDTDRYQRRLELAGVFLRRAAWRAFEHRPLAENPHPPPLDRNG